MSYFIMFSKDIYNFVFKGLLIVNDIKFYFYILKKLNTDAI